MAFPHNLTLEETSRVIARHNEELGVKAFVEAVRGPFTIFNYIISFDGSFPEFTGDPIRDREIGIIRECRGLIFRNDTGEVASRRYVKFFNLGQNAESQIDKIDFSVPHFLMEKMDGSMLSSTLNPVTGEREWHSKMGRTDMTAPVELHVSTRPEYERLSQWCEEHKLTALYEWVSLQQRIVLAYPEDKLVLLHIRDNITGEYFSRDEIHKVGEQFGIPTVRVYENTIKDIHEFVEHTRGLKNLEGYVVHFYCPGHPQHDLMIKMKADEYCLLHNSKEQLNLEKNAIALLLSDEIDDLLPQLDASDRDAITAFSDAVY